MSMSTHVVGFRPPDAKWTKMKEAWDACRTAGVLVPDEVDRFFAGEPPDEAGIKVDLSRHDCCAEYCDNGRGGFEVDIAKLPANITKIRFYNSW